MLPKLLILIGIVLVNYIQCAEAHGMDFGDGCALIIGMVLLTFGVLACLGKYARAISAA